MSVGRATQGDIESYFQKEKNIMDRADSRVESKRLFSQLQSIQKNISSKVSNVFLQGREMAATEVDEFLDGIASLEGVSLDMDTVFIGDKDIFVGKDLISAFLDAKNKNQKKVARANIHRKVFYELGLSQMHKKQAAKDLSQYLKALDEDTVNSIDDASIEVNGERIDLNLEDLQKYVQTKVAWNLSKENLSDVNQRIESQEIGEKREDVIQLYKSGDNKLKSQLIHTLGNRFGIGKDAFVLGDILAQDDHVLGDLLELDQLNPSVVRSQELTKNLEKVIEKVDSFGDLLLKECEDIECSETDLLKVLTLMAPDIISEGDQEKLLSRAVLVLSLIFFTRNQSMKGFESIPALGKIPDLETIKVVVEDKSLLSQFEQICRLPQSVVLENVRILFEKALRKELGIDVVEAPNVEPVRVSEPKIKLVVENQPTSIGYKTSRVWTRVAAVVPAAFTLGKLKGFWSL